VTVEVLPTLPRHRHCVTRHGLETMRPAALAPAASRARIAVHHPRAPAPSRRVVRARFVPPIVPNPNADGASSPKSNTSPTLPAIERALAPLGWKVGAERGYDDTEHAYKIYKTRDGQKTLERLQDALYTTEERGCRIRRETQSMYYLCCDGVRCRLNESKQEIVVEVPCDMGSLKAIGDMCAKIDATVKAKK
jgi:hypothetical protein